MDKKDIYEHLAKIYLGSTPAKNKKVHIKDLKNYFFAAVAIILGILILVSVLPNKRKLPLLQETDLTISPEIVKINYKLDPVEEESYSIDLTKLDLTRSRMLGFSIRKANFKDDLILKVVLTDNFNKKSEIQISDMPAYRWQDYKINLAEFKDISKWPGMSSLSFIVEAKEVQGKMGVVYIDNVRMIK